MHRKAIKLESRLTDFEAINYPVQWVENVTMASALYRRAIDNVPIWLWEKQKNRNHDQDQKMTKLLF